MDIKEIINQRYAMPDASLDRLQHFYVVRYRFGTV